MNHEILTTMCSLQESKSGFLLLNYRTSSISTLALERNFGDWFSRLLDFPKDWLFNAVRDFHAQQNYLSAYWKTFGGHWWRFLPRIWTTSFRLPRATDKTSGAQIAQTIKNRPSEKSSNSVLDGTALQISLREGSLKGSTWYSDGIGKGTRLGGLFDLIVRIEVGPKVCHWKNCPQLLYEFLYELFILELFFFKCELPYPPLQDHLLENNPLLIFCDILFSWSIFLMFQKKVLLVFRFHCLNCLNQINECTARVSSISTSTKFELDFKRLIFIWEFGAFLLGWTV